MPQDNYYYTDGFTPLVVRSQNGYMIIDNAGGVMFRSAETSDKVEVRIPLSFFSENPDLISDISFNSSNLGPQSFSATGTPTMPFMVCAIGFVIAAASFVHKKRKTD